MSTTDSRTWREQLEYQRILNLEKFCGERKSSQQWLDVTNEKTEILDPDGWDRMNWEKSWNEPIPLEEFYHRLDLSTCIHPRKS